MTAAQRSELQRAQQWSAAVAAVLDEITDRVGTAARRLSDGWPDARGREWTERLVVLHHALRRDADAAAALGQAIGHAADDPSADDPTDDGPPSSGPLLGGTSARRVDDRRGVTIPRLNDGADGGG